MRSDRTRQNPAGKIKGFLLGIAAAVSYGLNPSFALPMYAGGMNPDSVLLFRYGFAILIVAVMMLADGTGFRIPRTSILPLAGLGALMAVSSLTLFISYNYMAAGIASTILFVYPILVAFIMALFYKERITVTTVLCLLTASAGILLLYNTGDGGTLSLTGTLIVMASALSYALYLVWIGKGRVAGLPSLTATFYVLCFGFLLFAGRLAAGCSPMTLPSRPLLWLDALALAVFPTAISLLCTKAAIRLVGSTPTAILGALEPVTALVAGYFFFDEGITGREALGIFLILAAVSTVITDS